MRLDSTADVRYAQSMAGISDTLRRLIRADGRSLRQLASDARVDVAQVVRFVNGNRGLTTPAVDMLCEHLGLELRPKKPGKRAKVG